MGAGGSRERTALAAGFALGAGSYALYRKLRAKDEPSLRCPATEWPAGAPLRAVAYPPYDLADKKGSFLKVCDRLIEEVCDELPRMYALPPRELRWVREMLAYNTKGGKMNRGLMVVECGVILYQAKGLELTNEVLNQFAVLGWCIEWLQAWLLVADDVMDSSLTRRGQPCWYKRADVGHIAINDAFLIEMLVFKVIKRHFGEHKNYLQLLDLFMETTLQTECGQLLDLLCENIELRDFSVERWTLIVKYKTAFYSFYLPVALGMTLAGVTDRAAYDAAREILLIMGVYFQAQDDYLDAFGTQEQIGKIGTDIQDKKCGWLFVHAYNDLVSAEQKALLDRTYGKCKVGSKEEVAIKEMYAGLGLQQLYEKYEEDSYKQIMALKDQGNLKEVPWAVFDVFLAKIYKRSK